MEPVVGVAASGGVAVSEAWRIALRAAVLVGGCAYQLMWCQTRAWSFGLDGRFLVLVGLTGAVMGGFVAGVHTLAGGSLRSALAAGLFCALVPTAVVEVWCTADELAFRSEAAAMSPADHSRARWWPFGSSGLMCGDGMYSAHD